MLASQRSCWLKVEDRRANFWICGEKSCSIHSCCPWRIPPPSPHVRRIHTGLSECGNMAEEISQKCQWETTSAATLSRQRFKNHNPVYFLFMPATSYGLATKWQNPPNTASYFSADEGYTFSSKAGISSVGDALICKAANSSQVSELKTLDYWSSGGTGDHLGNHSDLYHPWTAWLCIYKMVLFQGLDDLYWKNHWISKAKHC